MVAAEACVRAARAVVIVGAFSAVERNAELESVIAACLTRVYFIVGPAVCSGIEMAAGAGLDIIAACLHVPEKSFSQLNCRGFVGDDSFHAENGGNRNTGERRERP